ncbi:unnamed protein product, partial [marine sediment metagenome]
TEEKDTDIDNDAWNIFNFSDPKPSLIAETDYILVVWGDKYARIRAQDLGPSNTYWFESNVYNDWPATLDGPTSSYDRSIYCFYTEGEANEAPTAPTSLEVDGKSTPTGANCVTATPQFTAIFNDPDAGDESNAIQIQVGSAEGLSDMWNSDWLADSTVEGNRCSAKTYDGAALSAGTSYWWRCRFRDDDDAEGAWSDWQQFDVCAAEPEPEVGLLECAPGGPLPKRCPFRVR